MSQNTNRNNLLNNFGYNERFNTGLHFFLHFSARPGFLSKGITIDDLQEIGKSPVVKHRFTMCCRLGTIAC